MRRPATSSTASRNRWFLDPLFRGGYPGRPARALRGALRRRRGRTTSQRSRCRSTSSASTTTGGTSSPEAITAAARSSSQDGCGLHGHGLGGLARRAVRPARAARATTTTSPAIHVTENGAAFADAPRARRQACETRSGAAYLEAPPRGDRPRDRRRRSGRGLLRLVAARQLRVGTRLLRDASGSSTSTTRRSSECRSRASTGIAITSHAWRHAYRCEARAAARSHAGPHAPQPHRPA